MFTRMPMGPGAQAHVQEPGEKMDEAREDVMREDVIWPLISLVDAVDERTNLISSKIHHLVFFAYT